MDKGSAYALRIERMQDGGYIVLQQQRSSPLEENRFHLYGPLFAATTIDECFKYIRHVLEPVKSQQGTV